MTTPFSYHLYHVPTGRHYYGIRYRRGCKPSDLWSTYFSSSKRVEELIEEYGADSFRVRVRRTFRTGAEALAWEEKLLTRIDAASRPDWINESNGGKNFRPPKRHTRKTKALLSKRITGKKRSEETKRRMRESAIRANAKRKASGHVYAKASPERIEKIRAARQGTKKVFLPDGSWTYSIPM